MEWKAVKEEPPCAGVCSLIHIIKPIDQIKERKSCGEDNPWPSVDGVDVCQIRDFDFQLWGASAQSSFLGLSVTLQTGSSGVPVWAARLPVLDASIIQHQGGGVSSIGNAGSDLVSGYFIMDLERRQQNVPLRVHLRSKRKAQSACLWGYGPDY